MSKMRRGFSYIETLLALLIMSLALFPALDGFRQSGLNQAYAESRYKALVSADSILQTMADALRNDKDPEKIFLDAGGDFPEQDFACRMYVSDESAEEGYRVLELGSPPDGRDFVPPDFYQSGIAKKKPDLRIGEEISYLNSDISAEEKGGSLRITISPKGGEDFYYLICEGESYGNLYFEKQSERDIFIELETEEGRDLELETSEGIYIVKTEKKKESRFLVLDVYEKKGNSLFKRFVRFI